MLKSNTLEHYRKELAFIDEQLITLIYERNRISEEIGKIKFAKKAKIKQPEVWNLHSEIRNSKTREMNLNEKSMNKIFKSIHKESIKIQKDVFKELKKNGK
jgi:chorismate mutase